MTRSDPPEHTSEQELLLRQQAKQRIRSRMRGLRRQLPDEARGRRSAAIAERVTGLDAFQRARTVLSFMAIRGEVDPAAITHAAHAAGKLCALPRVDVEADRLALHHWREGDMLEPSSFGVPEPLPTAPPLAPEEVDLVVVPALALDERGHRIGYGKGFYDRLLPTMPDAVRCAIAYDFQLVAEVPDMPGDERAHLVVTDERVVRIDPETEGGAGPSDPASP